MAILGSSDNQTQQLNNVIASLENVNASINNVYKVQAQLLSLAQGSSASDQKAFASIKDTMDRQTAAINRYFSQNFSGRNTSDVASAQVSSTAKLISSQNGTNNEAVNSEVEEVAKAIRESTQKLVEASKNANTSNETVLKLIGVMEKQTTNMEAIGKIVKDIKEGKISTAEDFYKKTGAKFSDSDKKIMSPNVTDVIQNIKSLCDVSAKNYDKDEKENDIGRLEEDSLGAIIKIKDFLFKKEEKDNKKERTYKKDKKKDTINQMFGGGGGGIGMPISTILLGGLMYAMYKGGGKIADFLKNFFGGGYEESKGKTSQQLANELGEKHPNVEKHRQLEHEFNIGVSNKNRHIGNVVKKVDIPTSITDKWKYAYNNLMFNGEGGIDPLGVYALGLGGDLAWMTATGHRGAHMMATSLLGKSFNPFISKSIISGSKFVPKALHAIPKFGIKGVKFGSKMLSKSILASKGFNVALLALTPGTLNEGEDDALSEMRFVASGANPFSTDVHNSFSRPFIEPLKMLHSELGFSELEEERKKFGGTDVLTASKFEAVKKLKHNIMVEFYKLLRCVCGSGFLGRSNPSEDIENEIKIHISNIIGEIYDITDSYCIKIANATSVGQIKQIIKSYYTELDKWKKSSSLYKKLYMLGAGRAEMRNDSTFDKVWNFVTLANYEEKGLKLSSLYNGDGFGSYDAASLNFSGAVDMFPGIDDNAWSSPIEIDGKLFKRSGSGDIKFFNTKTGSWDILPRNYTPSYETPNHSYIESFKTKEGKLVVGGNVYEKQDINKMWFDLLVKLSDKLDQMGGGQVVNINAGNNPRTISSQTPVGIKL